MRKTAVAQKITSVNAAQYYMERRVPKFLAHRYEGGASNAVTLRRNTEDFDQITFRPRTARGSKARDLRTTVQGTDISMPVMIAPTGGLALGYWDGERAQARAAGEAGTAMILSTSAGTAVEDVAAATTGPLFYQLHHLFARENSEQMIERAKAAGCRALVFTVDMQGGTGAHERSPRDAAFTPTSYGLKQLLRIAPQVVRRPGWVLDFLRHRSGLTVPMAPLEDGKQLSVLRLFEALAARPSRWEDMEWIRERWEGPLVVKGILTVEDAREAVSRGADGIVISNHGGLVLDSSPSTISVLPGIVDAVGSQTEVWIDGGFRRGSDVVKALALGAKGVLIGRPAIFALMAAGEPGVAQMLRNFRQGMEGTLAALGCESIHDLTRDHVSFPTEWLTT